MDAELDTTALYAEHQRLDAVVADARKQMGVIDAEISRREALAYVPGPAGLIQTASVDSSKGVVDWLKNQPAEFLAKIKEGLK